MRVVPRGLLYVVVALMGLDAATTYIIVASGSGREVNPMLQFVNEAPHAIFFVYIFMTLALAALLDAAEFLAAKLPSALGARIRRIYTALFAAAAACRAAAVANNVMGIVFGTTPLADALYA